MVSLVGEPIGEQAPVAPIDDTFVSLAIDFRDFSFCRHSLDINWGKKRQRQCIDDVVVCRSYIFSMFSFLRHVLGIYWDNDLLLYTFHSSKCCSYLLVICLTSVRASGACRRE